MKGSYALAVGGKMTEGNGARARKQILLTGFAILTAGCSPKKQPISEAKLYDLPPALVSNGRVGIRLGPLLTSRGWNGEELLSFDGKYDSKGEEKILHTEFGMAGLVTEGQTESGWHRVEPIDDSVVLTSYPYGISSNGQVKIDGKSYSFKAKFLMHPERGWIAYDLKIEGFNGPVRIDGARSGEGGAVALEGSFSEGYAPKNSIAPAVKKKVDTLPTIQIDSTDSKDAEFVSNALWRLQSEMPSSDRPFAPMGLTSDLYGGHTFWDADVWMMPVFVLCAPDRAAALAKYRLNRAQQAAENYRIWVASGGPIGKGKLAPRQFEPGGMKYPWESSISGKETVPGPSQFEDHISGSVLHGLDLAKSYGLADSAQVKQVGAGISTFYRSRADEIKPGEWGIRGTMSPDELHIGDNDLYTNLLAEWSNHQYGEQAWKAYRPRDATSLLTYDNDGLRSYKQAAAVLSIYPLQDSEAESQGRAMMDRFSSKIIKNGPAMSESIHALIWARLGENEKAYNLWRESWIPFIRGPLMLFNEKRNSLTDRTYFYTGAAGCLQTVLYGFAGFRLDTKSQSNSKWQLKLKSGKVLSISPHLPTAWRSITMEKFVIDGNAYRFTISSNEVKVQVLGETSGTN